MRKARANRLLLLLLAFLCVAVPANAQKSGKKKPKVTYQRPTGDPRARYEEARRKMTQRYDSIRQVQNERYAKALAEAWGTFKGEKPVPAPDQHDRLPQQVLENMKSPESIEAMVVESQSTDAINFRGAIIRVRDFFRNRIQVKPLVEMRSESTDRKGGQGGKSTTTQSRREQGRAIQSKADVTSPAVGGSGDKPHTFTYYGTPMAVDMGDLPRQLRLSDVQPVTVAEAWTLCSQPQYKGLVQDCLELRERYHLCDYAYLQMIKLMADTYLGKDTDASTFLTAYIYCQSGYRIRLAQTGGRLLMLYGSQHMIYGTSYFPMDGMNFFPLGGENIRSLSTIQACSKAINNSEQSISLLLDVHPSLTAVESKKRFIESDKYPEVNMEVSVNENLIRFFNDYPVSGASKGGAGKWAMYANTPLAPEVKEQIYPGLRKALDGLSEQEQVRRLLSLIQPRSWDKPETSLQYEYDDSIWGQDRVFFAEETLFYPYSDCEDHAILFSRLVRDLLGLKVILVHYPDHLATAVQFHQPLEGPYQDRLILSNGESYYICDPTNGGLPEPGATMQGEDNATAEVVILD